MNDELRAHLAALVESSGDAIVSKTLDGRVTSWNQGAFQLFGYRPEEIVGRSITIIIPPELEHEEREILSKIRAGVPVDHYETTRLAKDGRRFPVSISVSPIRNAGGLIVGAAKIARDISAQKRAEAALRDEAHALDTLNRVARVVAAELDLERLVHVVTTAATELSGAAFGAFFYNKQDASGGTYVLSALSGASREAFSSFPLPRNTAVFGPTFRGEGPVRSDDITTDPRYGTNAPHAGVPEGHLPVKSYLAVPVVSRLGEVLGGLFLGHPEAAVFGERAERLVQGIAAQAAIGIDNAQLYRSAQNEIAERRRVEQALRRSERLYRGIGESIDHGIWVCDASGRNQYASESFLRLVGLTQQQCSEFGWSEVLHPDDLQPTLDSWRQCVEREGTWDVEHRFLGVDGQYHPVLARGVPVRDDEGKVVCWAGINLDISRLKQAEAGLRDADRRKDEFLAILAHELRNPLAPIRYALTIAKQPGCTDAQRTQAEEVVERQVKHMSRLLEDLLDVSRISNGRLELRPTRLEVSAALASAVETARPIVERKGHVLTIELPPDSLAIDADAVRMAQVFANVLINAAKYTEPGGEIRVRAFRDGDQAVVSIRDNGIGISQEMRSRLFSLFSRAAPALKHSEAGLGIGLALARSIVLLHGGTIDAFSEGPRLGSEIVVRLPLARGEVGPAEATTAQGRSVGGLRVLVADDNEDGLQLSAELLEMWGHQVRSARCGREALELSERFRPQVLLLDIGMPDMSGYDVARAVRGTEWGKPALLVALTGWGRPEDKRLAREVGFDHHLTKPVDPDELGRLLSHVARPDSDP